MLQAVIRRASATHTGKRWLFLFMSDENLKNLEVLLASMKTNHLTRDEFVREFTRVLEFVKALKEGNQQAWAKITGQIGGIVSRLKEGNALDLAKTKKEALGMISAYIKQIDKTTAEKIKEVDLKIKELKNGIDGKDADDKAIGDRVINEVQAPIIEKVEKDLPKLGGAIRDALELLEGEDRLKIEAIRGLNEILDELKRLAGQAKGFVGGGLTRGVADGLYAPLGSLGGDFEVESGTIAAGTTEYTFLNEISKVYSFNVGSQFIQPDVYTVADDTITIEAADATGWDGLAYTLIYKKA